MNKCWTDSDIAYLVENYNNKTAKQIALHLSKTYSAVTSKANSLELAKDKKRIKVNENFFNIPNNINCYWAGFVAADGYVRDKVNNFGIGLARKDREHLVRFKNDCGYEGEIKDRETKNRQIGDYHYDVIQISIIEICGVKSWLDDLSANFNITPKKSLTLIPPKSLTKEQSLCFIKGLIDGDGTIYVDEYGRLQFSIVGTREILKWIASIFDLLVPSQSKLLSTPRQRSDKGSKNHWTYKITGFRALEILRLLDNIETPKLERKWACLKLSIEPTYNCRYKV